MSLIEPVLPSLAAWLELPDGSQLRVGSEGLTIGRRLTSNVILTDARVSLSHCHVMLVPDGLELSPLGRNPTRVNSTVISGRTPLVDGDSIDLPGVSLEVVLQERAGTPLSGWRLSQEDGLSLSIRPLPFQIGGGADDHLLLRDLPESSIVFHAVDTGMAVEVLHEVQQNGEPVVAGTITHTVPGDRWNLGKVELLVECDQFDVGQTQLMRDSGAVEVEFCFLAEGARLDLRLHPSNPRRSLLLPEMRARLIATLLRPPRDYRAGEDIPDDVLIPSIWPGQIHRGGTDLNQLIHRTRKDLIKAGVDPHAILERVGRVGATRFRLASDAKVQFGD